MNIKLNKYVNHFKATSILCLCVNKSYTPLTPFFSLACLAVKITVNVTVPVMMCHFLQPTITNRYSNPYMLFTRSLVWIPQWVVSSCLLYRSCVCVHPFAGVHFMFCASRIDLSFPVVCPTPSFFIYAEGTNCDICITNFHTTVCLLSHVELYKKYWCWSKTLFSTVT